jgi:hypothetical protein
MWFSPYHHPPPPNTPRYHHRQDLGSLSLYHDCS